MTRVVLRGRQRAWRAILACGFVAPLAVLSLASGAAHAQSGGSAVVRMYDEGFVPSRVEIQEGESVIFENRGKSAHWPASNIHPTHHVYPEFDARRDVAPGERWTFRFDRPGVWTYHDHLHPEAAGTIIVKARPGAVTQEWDSRVVRPVIRLASAWSHAVRVSAGKLYYWLFPGELEKVVRNFNVRRVAAREGELRYWVALLGSKRIMAVLIERSSGGSTFDCHQEAHQIGRVAYSLHGAVAFQKADASCGSGFYHGALEGFLTERGTLNFAAEIDELCNRLETRFAQMQCHHGVGHGVMAYEGYDLPRALDMCGDLKQRQAQRSCYDGVFMENIVAAQGFGALRGHKPLWVNRDPHFPCNAISQEPDIQFHCYQMQTSWMLSLTQDHEAVVRECLKARDDLRGVCFKSFGRDAASLSLQDRVTILKVCAKAPRGEARYYDECIGGAVGAIVQFWGDDLGDQANEVCAHVEGASKRHCYGVTFGWIRALFADPARQRRACETFESPYREACMR